MFRKNTLFSCASAAALTLALARAPYAEEVTGEAAAPEESQTSAPLAAAPSVTSAAAQAVPPEAAEAAAAPVATAPAVPPMMEPPALPPDVAEKYAEHVKVMAEKQAEHEKKMAERRAEHEKRLGMKPEERWEARRAELSAHYQDLRARAAESGVELPETPPWQREPHWMSYDEMRQQMQQQGVEMPEQPTWPAGRGPGMGLGRMLMSDEERQAIRESMAQMTPEERAAFHEQHYQKMRERAQAQGMDLPETPPWMQAPDTQEPPPAPPEPDWAKVQETIAGMTQEERDACKLMHRRHVPPPTQTAPWPMAAPEGAPGYGYGPGYGRGRGYGYGQGPGLGYGPGYGYGRGQGSGPRRGQWQGYPE